MNMGVSSRAQSFEYLIKMLQTRGCVSLFLGNYEKSHDNCVAPYVFTLPTAFICSLSTSEAEYLNN